MNKKSTLIDKPSIPERRTVQDNYGLLFSSRTKIIRPKRRSRPTDGKWRLIVFVNKIRYIIGPLLWEDAKTKRDHYIEQGYKAAIAHRIHGNFEPKGHGEAGQLWCPYCRAWRYFKVDQRDPVFGPGEIPTCPYCCISVVEYWVKVWNGDVLFRRRSRASIRRRKQRMS